MKTFVILLVFTVMVACNAQDPLIPRICTYPLETGPCRAMNPRYGFVPSKNQCVFFTYGGCAGNENRFNTKEECEKRCLRK